ncbi:hypothetical protein MLD38_033724 [Melastoma candidum]|uniref:Uncharacterized protein n=1 Tax=Melastoma candidum TaxID=119954 RepID=A0ACB9M7C8_9MYRT|nr:hypothetical protein MLD38_033724 [Melastoma candidum]
MPTINILTAILWHFPLVVLVGLASYLVYQKQRSSSVYLLDFECHHPPPSYRFPTATFHELIYLDDRVDPESRAFLIKIIQKSGYSEETSIPPPNAVNPVMPSITHARDEAAGIIFTTVQNLLSVTNISPRAIDVLICNSSMFSPTPSLTAMVVNEFKMRSNVLSYNLSGMGCSAGIVSIALARDLLKARRNSLALIVSMEVLSLNWYGGKIPSMLVTNCLFRMGGAALLMSSRNNDRCSAKYELQQLVRTNKAREDRCYACVYQDVDPDNKTGVSISKDIPNVAGETLKANMVSLAPLVLPYSEQVRYVWSAIREKVRIIGRKEAYMPNFKKAFEHFCIHAGGKAVIEAVEKNLGLSKEDVEASEMTLHKFGNTSSSSIWYELAYLETKRKIKTGDRVWQIAFGSGFKCNSAVWKCISSQHTRTADAWKGKIKTDLIKEKNPL